MQGVELLSKIEAPSQPAMGTDTAASRRGALYLRVESSVGMPAWPLQASPLSVVRRGVSVISRSASSCADAAARMP